MVHDREVVLHGHRVAIRVRGDLGAGEPVVLLVHGLAGSASTWDDLLARLDDGVTVVAPDLLGHGRSDKPRHDYSLGSHASTLRDLLVALGIERATVVGHSFGTFVTRQLAHAHPDRVARMILIGTAVTPVSPATLEAEGAVRELRDSVPASFAREFQSSTVYAPVPDTFFEGLIAESLKLPARLWRATGKRPQADDPNLRAGLAAGAAGTCELSDAGGPGGSIVPST